MKFSLFRYFDSFVYSSSVIIGSSGKAPQRNIGFWYLKKMCVLLLKYLDSTDPAFRRSKDFCLQDLDSSGVGTFFTFSKADFGSGVASAHPEASRKRSRLSV